MTIEKFCKAHIHQSANNFLQHILEADSECEIEIETGCEFWFISNELAILLRYNSETVQEYHGLQIWTREFSMEPFSMDGVINVIYENIGDV